MRKLLIALVVIPSLFCLSDPLLQSNEVPTQTQQELAVRKKIVVVTRIAPTVYYEGRNGVEGFDYDLINAFAHHMQLPLEIKVLGDTSQVLEAISTNQADLAVAGLTRTAAREEFKLFGPDYYQVRQEVVCRRGGTIPKSIEELNQVTLQITRSSSYHERLRELRKTHPNLRWEAVDEPTEKILEDVWLRKTHCTVADSNIVAINQRYYPELVVAFPITEDQPLAWIVSQQAQDLTVALDAWFQQVRESGQLASLQEHYFGHVEMFDYVDTAIYHKRINQRLPKFRQHFEKAANRYNIDWSLLAAQAYQESHWDPLARSHTGVRGVMMLTQRTAKDLGVTNRLSPDQSIMGGAQYLAYLLERVPASVVPEDQLRFALAAYNVGFGHVMDARKLAVKLGKDPDRWVELKTVLPLLSNRKYYRNLKHGRARGSEPVRYVEQIYNYWSVLQKSVVL